MSIAAAAGAASQSIRQILEERELKRQQALIESARAQQMQMERARLGMQFADRARQRQIEEAGIRLEGMAPNQDVTGADLEAIQGTPYESRLETRQTLPSRSVAAAGGADVSDAGGTSFRTLRPTAEQQDRLNLIANLRKIEEDPNTAPTLKRVVGLKRVGVNASAEDVETPQERAARLAGEDTRTINRTREIEGIQHQNRLGEIAASGAQARANERLVPVVTVENGQEVTKYLPESQVIGRTFPRPATGNTAQDRQRKARMESARGFLDRLNELRESINTNIGPRAGLTGLARQSRAAIGLDPDVAEYERVRAAAGRALAVAIMGAQNLSDADAAAWANMLPGARIDKVTAKRLTDQIGKMLDEEQPTTATGGEGASRANGVGPAGDSAQKWGRDAQGRPVRQP